MVEILCTNDGKTRRVKLGSTLLELAQKTYPEVTDPKTGKKYPTLAVLVDHKLKDMCFQAFFPHEVTFIGYNHPDGRRTYNRSLCFLLQHAVRDVYPDKVLVIEHSLPSGLYCELREGTPSGPAFKPDAEGFERLRARMREMVDANLPFKTQKIPSEEAEALFEAQGQRYKAELRRSLGRYFCRVYYLDGQVDTFHGPMVPSTGYLQVFGLMPFHKGFCLQPPSQNDITRVTPRRPQSKLSATFKEYSAWCHTTGIGGIGTLNKRLLEGGAVKLINLCEARQEREYVRVADLIYAQRDRVKIVFLAGPSSSGKTSSSLRLAQQLRILGMEPKVIELDNYFVSRERTPIDDDGEYDFEALEAMDLELLGNHLNTLLAGGKVEIPRYDFKQGRPFFEGNFMELDENDILVMEGIHARGPEPHFPRVRIGIDLPERGREQQHLHHRQPAPAPDGPGLPLPRHEPGGDHPPLAVRPPGREQVHLPVPGERRRAVQLRPPVRASVAEVLCGAPPASHPSFLAGLYGRDSAAQVSRLHRRPDARGNRGRPADIHLTRIHRRSDPVSRSRTVGNAASRYRQYAA